MSERIALLAEAGMDIGTGHLIETLELGIACQLAGLEPLIVVNVGTPEKLLSRISGKRWIVQGFTPDVLQGIGAKLANQGVRLAITNFRHITNNQVVALAQEGIRVVCVDEWGRKHLDCDVVLNPSLVQSRYHYTSDHPSFRLYTGTQYLALSPEFANWHAQTRRFEGEIGSVVISMGGMDRTGATLKIAQALLTLGTNVDTHIVVGAGFRWTTALQRLMQKSRSNRWRIHRNVLNLASLFAASDVAFTAGGNTLAELACVGTPAIVAYEDEHELEQGEAFEKEGFGRVIGRGISVSAETVAQTLRFFGNAEVRNTHCAAGRRLVDGRGCQRIADCIERLVDDSTVATATH